MFRFVLAALVVSVCFAGCANPKQQLLGTWRVEPNSVVNLSKAPPSKEIADTKSLLSQWTFTFTDDDKVNETMMGIKQSGTYVLTGRTVTIQGLGGTKENSVIIATMSDDGKSMKTIGPGRPLRFVKKP